MNAKQHISFSIYSATLPISAIAMTHYIDISYLIESVSVENSLNLVVGVVVGSLLPDIDHQNSIAGHIIPLHLLRKLHRIFRHGGITHTLAVNLLIAGFGIYYQSLLVVAMAFGYWSHLYLDHITGNKLGMLYFPFNRKGKRK